MDLWKEIAFLLHLKPEDYEFELTADEMHGQLQDGVWNGEKWENLGKISVAILLTNDDEFIAFKRT